MEKAIKAREPVQKRGIETKAKVVEAARELFVEKGYYKTHALEIAARAGVATGTFYSYFNNKKEVLLELMRQFYREALDKALVVLDAETLTPGNAREFIHTLIHFLYAFHASQYDLHRALFPLTFLVEDGLEISRKEEQAVIHSIAAYFEEYQHLLRVTNLQAAAEIAFKVSDEIIHRILFWGSESAGKDLILELEDMLFRYLFHPAK